MTARKKARNPAAQAAATTPVAVQPDTVRQQIAVASESAQAMRRGFDAMRKINDRALQGALARFTSAAGKYAKPREPLALLAIPADLMRTEMQEAASYWQDLSGAALEMQAELLGCSSHLVDSDAVLETVSAVDTLPAFPLFPTWAGPRH
jgi:hypothetical protein